MKKNYKSLEDKKSAENFSDLELKDLAEAFVDHLKNLHNLNPEKIKELLQKKPADSLPISIFNNKELSCLETVVKYLKEEFGLKFHEIALMLNRDDRTIWTTYNIACKKRKEKLQVKESKIFIPISILKERKFSVLEAIVGHLKDNFDLRYSEIAALLNRDERNMWTVYNRYKKKK